MGTKQEELATGCFAAALDDEPMFVLLARDPQAPGIVMGWADGRLARIGAGKAPDSDMEKIREARKLSAAMRAWRIFEYGSWRDVRNRPAETAAADRSGAFTPPPAPASRPLFVDVNVSAERDRAAAMAERMADDVNPADREPSYSDDPAAFNARRNGGRGLRPSAVFIDECAFMSAPPADRDEPPVDTYVPARPGLPIL